jgi:hypothetical protein
MYMHPEEFADIQHDLGLSDNELRDALMLSKETGSRMIRRMKTGDVAISGPVATCMFAFVDGFRPESWPS